MYILAIRKSTIYNIQHHFTQTFYHPKSGPLSYYRRVKLCGLVNVKIIKARPTIAPEIVVRIQKSCGAAVEKIGIEKILLR